MDGVEPYNGYDGYGPGMGDSDIPDDTYNASVTTDHEQEIQPPVIAETTDTGRLYEVVLLGEGVSVSGTYTSPRAGYGEIPKTAVFSDAGRVSIHPLGIVEKPPGVVESRWLEMDMDRLFSPDYDSTSVGEEELPYEESGKEKESLQVTGAGGSGGEGKPPEEEEHDPTEMPFLDHLEEFRWALLKSIFAIVIGMLASWFMAERFITTITRLATSAELKLVYIKILGPIMIRLQTALFMGIVLSLPFVFYFIWSFVSPGLYKREKKWFLPAILFGTLCFLIGASIAYFIIIPFILKFIKLLMVWEVVGMFEINDFILWMLKFTVLFGVLFEMPMVSFYLAKIGILKYRWMSRYRKYAIVLIFILGAILTPPDPLSQIMMAVPLILLYEISIIMARIAGRKTLI